MATADKIYQAKVARILRIEGVGPATFWKALAKEGDIDATYAAFADKFDSKDLGEWVDLIASHASRGIECVGFWQAHYPSACKNSRNLPPLLWYRGKRELFAEIAVAVVGGRNASFHGIRFAHCLSESLGAKNVTVVSGLARGVDTAAHKGTMSVKGKTIAVLAGGVDRLYPKENQDLYDNIVADHLAISEMPPGIEPTAELFPRRNRLIAALTKGVCVIEAAIKSGSLLTANYALDLGLPIFACPGHPYDPRSKGCNLLIKQGAYVLESADDVIEHLNIFKHSLNVGNHASFAKLPKTRAGGSLAAGVGVSRADETGFGDDLSRELLDALSHSPILLDDLLNKLRERYSVRQITVVLGELELRGLIARPSPDSLTLA